MCVYLALPVVALLSLSCASLAQVTTIVDTSALPVTGSQCTLNQGGIQFVVPPGGPFTLGVVEMQFTASAAMQFGVAVFDEPIPAGFVPGGATGAKVLSSPQLVTVTTIASTLGQDFDTGKTVIDFSPLDITLTSGVVYAIVTYNGGSADFHCVVGNPAAEVGQVFSGNNDQTGSPNSNVYNANGGNDGRIRIFAVAAGASGDPVSSCIESAPAFARSLALSHSQHHLAPPRPTWREIRLFRHPQRHLHADVGTRICCQHEVG